MNFPWIRRREYVQLAEKFDRTDKALQEERKALQERRRADRAELNMRAERERAANLIRDLRLFSVELLTPRAFHRDDMFVKVIAQMVERAFYESDVGRKYLRG